jgi:CheY-like chemotaxis protein
VEDDGAVRVTAARILEKAGYTVLDAATPGVALALAKGHRGQIDLLLSDLLLPEEDGVTLSRRILEVRPGLRVAFMSGYAGEVLDTTLPPGCRFLSKPFTPDQLQSAVRQALET